MPWDGFGVIAMQLFNVRHGLFAFAPIWLLGYAGLCVGAAQGRTVAWQGLGLALIAVFTSIGVNPGECWPARFWVLSMPMLAVGLCLWWQAGTGPLLRGITVALAVVTLANTAMFLRAPNAFLENRQTS